MIDSEEGKLICIRSPWDRKANLIILDKPLPKNAGNNKTDLAYLKDKPWAIELTSGIRCVYDHTGTIWNVAGIPNSASCFDANHQLSKVTVFNLLDKKMPVWLVFIQKKSAAFFLEQTVVKTAWY